MIDPGPIGELSPWLLLVGPLVVVFAYTVFGISGFGSTVIAVPILAHFLPIAFLVPLMVLLDMSAALFVGTSSRRHVNASELKRVLPFMFVGFAVGLTLLVKVPQDWLKTALGLFTAIVGVHSLANTGVTRTISPWWCIPAGISAGAIATIFGAGGPIYITYLSGRLKDKSELRSTISTLISVSAFSRAILYAVSGLLFHVAIFAGMAVLAPFVWAGLRLGTRIHVGLTQEQMRRVIGGLLVFTGGSLLVRAVLG
jgi:uncharacterized membrane protein YfcA